VVTVALNILYGAAVLSRTRMLVVQGVTLAPGRPRLAPLDRGDIEKRSQTS
jgi:trans-AT polyketide synthase, acyltransferase and oxidoreductase domains